MEIFGMEMGTFLEGLSIVLGIVGAASLIWFPKARVHINALKEQVDELVELIDKSKADNKDFKDYAIQNDKLKAFDAIKRLF